MPPGTPFYDDDYAKVAFSKHPSFQVKQDEMGSDTEESDFDVDAEVEAEVDAEVEAAEELALDAEMAQTEFDLFSAEVENQLDNIEVPGELEVAMAAQKQSFTCVCWVFGPLPKILGWA